MKKPLILIEFFFIKFFKRIEENTKILPTCYPLIRIFSALYTLIYFLPKFSWIGELPNSFFQPYFLNFTNLFQGFLPKWYYTISDYVIIVLLCFITIGVFSKLFLRILAILLIINYGFQFSLGKIDHIILFPLFFFFLSFTNSGLNLAILKDKKSYYEAFSTSIMSIIIVFSYFTAGFEKFFTWIDFNLSTSGFLHWFYPNYFSLTRNQLLANHIFDLSPIIYEIVDYSAVILETSGFFFLIYSRKSWKLYLIIIAIFHLMNVLTLNIPFEPHIMIFSAWLLYPIIEKKNSLYLLYIIPLLIDGIGKFAFLWAITIGIGILNLLNKESKNSQSQ